MSKREPLSPEQIKDLKDWLKDEEPEALIADGFDDAIMGVVQIFNKILLVYDKEACLRILRDRDGLSEDEALEFFDYNVVGSYMGEYTPAFYESVDTLIL